MQGCWSCLKSGTCSYISLNIFKNSFVLIESYIVIPLVIPLESPGAMSGFIWDIESSITTLIWAYKGHMNNKWCGSSIPNPHLHDGSSSTWRLKCRCAFSLLQPIRILVWWIFTNLSPTLTHGILIGNGKWSLSLRSNMFRLRELRISIACSILYCGREERFNVTLFLCTNLRDVTMSS